MLIFFRFVLWKHDTWHFENLSSLTHDTQSAHSFCLVWIRWFWLSEWPTIAKARESPDCWDYFMLHDCGICFNDDWFVMKIYEHILFLFHIIYDFENNLDRYINWYIQCFFLIYSEFHTPFTILHHAQWYNFFTISTYSTGSPLHQILAF